MRRHLVNFFPIFIITGLFLGFGLVKITMAQGGQASPHGPYSPTTDACAGCHRVHNSAGTPILLTDVTNLCNVCHGAAPFGPVSTRNPGQAVASTNVALAAISTHGNRDFSERVETPFQLECAQCHDPHSITKLAGLRDYVWLTPAGDFQAGPIVFTATTGLNSFDDGASSPSSRICVSCHTNPDNPGYPMVYHAGGDHGNANYTGQDCMSCHPHDADGDPTTLDGFMPIQGAAPPTWPVFQSANFQMNEPASNPFVASEPNSNPSAAETAEQLRGTVHDPAETLLGDGYFYGDGLDNYIDFENNPTSLQANTSLLIELRLKPSGIATDTSDYEASIFDRSTAGNYRVSLGRMNSWTTYDAPLTAASIALWVKPEDSHSGAAWKPVLTDYALCPIVADHWYQVKIEWDSGKAVGIPGDIYVDDQGPHGDNLGEAWTSNLNCTNAGQTLVPTESRLYQGDQIQIGTGNYTIGANATDHSRDLYKGLIDWIMINQQPKSTPITIYLPLIMNDAASPGREPHSTTVYMPVILKDEKIRP